MKRTRCIGLALLLTLAASVAAQAQAPAGIAPLPFQVEVKSAAQPAPLAPPAAESISNPQQRAESDAMLTTKSLPWQRAEPTPAPNPAAPVVTAPGQQAMPAAIPFGRSTASHYQPIPEGPHTATAVPVEGIDSIESSEPAPAIPAENIANPAGENPAEPTELTAPIFAADKDAPLRSAIVYALNKVTARGQRLVILPTQVGTYGKLTIHASHCQRSTETSLPDAAALLEISEQVPSQAMPKKLFSGWMYQSSPSVTALEHPVYDVMLLGCEDPKPTAKKSATPPAKKKR